MRKKFVKVMRQHCHSDRREESRTLEISRFARNDKWQLVSVIWLAIALVGRHANAQDTLRLQDAIQQAVQNNYQIQIAKNNMQIARNNATLGNAGMLPRVTLGASYDFTNSNVQQRYASGEEVDRNNSQSTAVGSGVALNWIFFDGFRMFAIYDQLKSYRDVGEYDLHDRVNNTVSDVINGYYDVVRQQQFIQVTETSIDIAQQRLNISKAKYELGAAPRLDYTQSQIDLNNAQADLSEQQLALEQAKIYLNRLMARTPETPLNISDTLHVDSTKALAFAELRNQTLSNNPSLLRANEFVNVGESDVRIALSGYFPQLSLNAGYNFNNANNSTGLMLYNQSLGFNAGITASFNLFNGFNQHRLVRNSRLSLFNYELQSKSTLNDVESALLAAYRRFETKLGQLQLQEQSFAMARENMDVALERYRLGVINILDLRQLQLAYDESGNAVVQARYDAKLAEIELQRLSAQLAQ